MALIGTATQSTTHANKALAGSPFVASHANDGNFETSVIHARGACSITESTPPVWWQVDLLDVYEITKVAITTRNDWGRCGLSYFMLLVACLFAHNQGMKPGRLLNTSR